MDDWKLKTTPVVRLRRPSEAFVYFEDGLFLYIRGYFYAYIFKY